MGLHNSLSVVFLSSFFCIHALILLHSSTCLCLALATNETDRLALLQVKASITSDPLGVMASWNESNHFCSWHGVACGRRHRRVTVLDLNSLKLAGSISPHVGNLSFLRKLHLYNNSFTHEIPPEIGRLHRLEYLRLDNNSLSGEIPSNISGCTQLFRLSLGFNSLVGNIPQQLGALSKLIVFGIYFNHFTGSVPHSFANLSSLEIFSATSNHLSGSVLGLFGHLTNLNFLSLGGNRLSGVLPHSIFNLTSIEVFSVVLNKIQGTLPSNLEQSPAFQSLNYFGISGNEIQGTIPVSISNASNIVTLQIGENKLHGKVPSLQLLNRLEWLGLFENNLGTGSTGDLIYLCDMINATRLQRIEIQSNIFGGTLPDCIANLSSSLALFRMDDNKISGNIPNGIGNVVNLEGLSMSNNQLSGHIPPDLGKLQNLYGLDMSSNLLSGDIPFPFGNLSGLNELYLEDNKLQGNISPSLIDCRNLMKLSLRGNNFSGPIAQQLFLGFFSLYILDLSQNLFMGSLPEGIGKLINLEYLDLSANMLFGEIPATLGGCIRLEHLDMHGNLFQGKISSSLGSLRGLKVLDLSQNNFSGEIPEFLERFQVLETLNLSYNKFKGMVPAKGVFNNATTTSLQGNSQLCGGIPQFHLEKCKFPHSHNQWLTSRTGKLVMSLIFGIFVVTSTLAFCYFRFKWRGNKEKGASSDLDKYLKVSYQSLVKATQGFSPTNLIGAGSFGYVYKGVLEERGTEIAIKVLNLVRRGANKSFIAECEALKNIRHRNLLKVISVCSGSDYQGNDFKALVYDFMVNGSLEEWLHPADETIERPRNLTFSQRLNIAIDVAMALDYLHHQCPTAVVHCDLKPSNVLLDEDMVGHVGDFGLARFISKALKNPSGNHAISSGLKGTIGYSPPEYGMGHEAWKQGDVYSYGILLLEMFTGIRPTDDMFQGSSNLHSFVKAALPDQVIEVVDSILVLENVEGDQMGARNRRLNEESRRISVKNEDSLILIFEIGVACSAELARERLDISDVVAQMCRIRRNM